MKTTFRHYGPVAAMLAVILVAASCLSLFTGVSRTDDRPAVLVTTYPLYVAAQNILGDTDGVRLTLLSGVGAGCLHDYQLTPADRLALARADRVVINGLDSEPFLEGLVEEARLVDASRWIRNPLCTEGHNHENIQTDHGHEHADYNGHVWVSPLRYREQIQAVMGALCAADPANEAVYLANGTAYDQQVNELWLSFPQLTGRSCVLFHDSLAYLAADLGLEVKLTLSAEGESGLSAEDLATVERLAREDPDLILLYDTQYPIRYTAVEGLVPAGNVLALDTAVVGAGTPADWLTAMERNLEKLQKLIGGDTP